MSSLDIYGLPWILFLIVVVLNILFLTFAVRTMRTAWRTINRMREDGNQKVEMLFAEQSKVQQLEGAIKILEQDQTVLQNEKMHLELQSKIMQEKLEAQELRHEEERTLQLKILEQDQTVLQNEKMHLELQSKIMQEKLEAQELRHKEERTLQLKILEQDKTVLQNEKMHLELQSKIMQEKLEAQELRHEEERALSRKQMAEALRNLEVPVTVVLDAAVGTSDSDHHDKELVDEIKDEIKSEKPKTEETEKECKNINAFLQIQMEFHKKQAEENLMSARIAEHTLQFERKETAKLRLKLIEMNTELAKIKNPIVPVLQRDCIASETLDKAAPEDKQHMERVLEEKKKIVQLEETIKKMEGYQASLVSEKTNLENLHKILQEKFHIMENLCQEKDSALQQSLAQKEIDQVVKQIQSTGPKKEIRNFKQKIQEINERHEKTQNDLKKQIVFHQKKAQDNWVMACASERALTIKRKEVAILSKKLSEVSVKVAEHPEQLSKASSSRFDQHTRPLRKNGSVSKKNDDIADKSAQAESAGHGGSQCWAELVAEKTKVEQLGEKMKAMKEDHETLRKEILKLELHNKSFQGKLQNMKELCHQKDQALQQKAAQVDFERRDKERRIKEVLKAHEQKIQRIYGQHWKAELSYKSEIASLKKSQGKLIKPCASEHALKVPKNQVTSRCKQQKLDTGLAEPQRAPSVATPGCSRETPLEKKTIATQSCHGSSDKLVKLMSKAEDKQEVYLERLRLEEIKSQQLEKKVQTLEQDSNALMSEKSLLGDQITALQSELQIWKQLCQEKDQALQQNTVQVEAAQRVRDAEMQALALKITVLQKNVQTLEQDSNALKSTKSLLKHQTTALQSELQTVKRLCQQKDQALQQNTVQVEVAQRVRDAEMQALVLKITALKAELEQSQEYHAQIELQHQQAQENLMIASDQALEAERKTIVALQNQLAAVNAKLIEFQQTQLRPGHLYEALPLLSDTLEDVPLLGRMEAHSPETSAPSSSTRTQLVRPSQSLPEVESVKPTEKPRRFSMASIDSIQHEGAIFFKLCRK